MCHYCICTKSGGFEVITGKTYIPLFSAKDIPHVVSNSSPLPIGRVKWCWLQRPGPLVCLWSCPFYVSIRFSSTRCVNVDEAAGGIKSCMDGEKQEELWALNKSQKLFPFSEIAGLLWTNTLYFNLSYCHNPVWASTVFWRPSLKDVFRFLTLMSKLYFLPHK